MDSSSHAPGMLLMAWTSVPGVMTEHWETASQQDPPCLPRVTLPVRRTGRDWNLLGCGSKFQYQNAHEGPTLYTLITRTDLRLPTHSVPSILKTASTLDKWTVPSPLKSLDTNYYIHAVCSTSDILTSHALASSVHWQSDAVIAANTPNSLGILSVLSR